MQETTNEKKESQHLPRQTLLYGPFLISILLMLVMGVFTGNNWWIIILFAVVLIFPSFYAYNEMEKYGSDEATYITSADVMNRIRTTSKAIFKKRDNKKSNDSEEDQPTQEETPFEIPKEKSLKSGKKEKEPSPILEETNDNVEPESDDIVEDTSEEEIKEDSEVETEAEEDVIAEEVTATDEEEDDVIPDEDDVDAFALVKDKALALFEEDTVFSSKKALVDAISENVELPEGLTAEETFVLLKDNDLIVYLSSNPRGYCLMTPERKKRQTSRKTSRKKSTRA